MADDSSLKQKMITSVTDHYRQPDLRNINLYRKSFYER